jgi:hypothetical protein
MASMTIPQRISDFLSQRQERMYCDSCIQERLGLKWRQQVQLITATLAVTSAFCREVNKCCTCEEIKQVIQATCGQALAPATKPKLSAKKLRVDVSPRRQQPDSGGLDADALGAAGLEPRFTVSPVRRREYPLTASSGPSEHSRDG